MELIEDIQNYIRSVLSNKKYCQGCGTELTDVGGIVVDSDLYCGLYEDDGKQCLPEEAVNMLQGRPPIKIYFMRSFSSSGIQELAEEGSLTGFGPLEKKSI
ncbi:MAG: hypothetical protein QGF74_02310 [Candidatus Nanoarchaeia archaeon]|jgi:hypothetical protein|nr:hypothetical protein [Candidatus Nanoarchaeia archaeon]|tara:strand:+ start:6303 stop:6605 length:303 start_codon:yes stop_codon:yes gene_type:complete